MSRGAISMNPMLWFFTMKQSFSLFPLSRLRFSSLCFCSAPGRRAAKRMAYNNSFENGRPQAGAAQRERWSAETMRGNDAS